MPITPFAAVLDEGERARHFIEMKEAGRVKEPTENIGALWSLDSAFFIIHVYIKVT